MENLIASYGQPVITVVAAIAIGWLFDMFVFARLSILALKTSWVTDDAVAQSLHGMPVLWFTLLGIHIALPMTELSASSSETITKLLVVGWILSFTVGSVRLTSRMIKAYTARENNAAASSSIFVNLTRITIAAIGALIALNTLGVSITPLLTALGVGGIAVALALQEPLSNLFAGLQVILSKQIQPGDYIKLEGGQEGYVYDVTWRNTTIRMFSNDLVIVPNATVAASAITNYTSLDAQHSVYLSVGVSYESDLGHVENVTLRVATEIQKGTLGAVPEWEPGVSFSGFGDSSIDMLVILRAEEYATRFAIRHEFIKRLHSEFAREGIEIPFPQRVVHMTSEASAEEV
ncbi:MAG: mechanosensitive ion channel family protein [Actinomycetota bacterium]|nr:mechanosensitive ion channel family protein [Actinomycetota bacterium]